MTDKQPETDWEDEYSASRRRLAPYLGRIGLAGVGVLLLGTVLYYLLGMALVHRIDDDPDFTASQMPEGASRAEDGETAWYEIQT